MSCHPMKLHSSWAPSPSRRSTTPLASNWKNGIGEKWVSTRITTASCAARHSNRNRSLGEGRVKDRLCDVVRSGTRDYGNVAPMNDIALLQSANIAHAIAHAILEGFDKHYRIFREAAQQAKRQFEHAE